VEELRIGVDDEVHHLPRRSLLFLVVAGEISIGGRFDDVAEITVDAERRRNELHRSYELARRKPLQHLNILRLLRLLSARGHGKHPSGKSNGHSLHRLSFRDDES